ncbi:Inorganic phosphate transporter 1-1 [Euphorbia peplus]|nr:Inorganic phosphate transporter 1-1 [Euphorbia peplus]
MSICMAILGIQYGNLRGEKQIAPKLIKQNIVEAILYNLFGLALFFSNFGPNSTTFIVPAELFPARFQSTCHSISAAAGKSGSMIGAFVVQTYTLDGKSRKRLLDSQW